MTYVSIQEAQQGLMMVLGDMPEDIRNDVIRELSNPVMIEALVYTGEYLYSRRADLPAGAVRDAAADFVEFRSNNGFFGAHIDNRGPKMVTAIRSGEVKDSDPPVDPRFAAKPVIEVLSPSPSPSPLLPDQKE